MLSRMILLVRVGAGAGTVASAAETACVTAGGSEAGSPRGNAEPPGREAAPRLTTRFRWPLEAAVAWRASGSYSDYAIDWLGIIRYGVMDDGEAALKRLRGNRDRGPNGPNP